MYIKDVYTLVWNRYFLHIAGDQVFEDVEGLHHTGGGDCHCISGHW